MHLAARAGDTRSVQIMARKPEDLTVVDLAGRNALHYAASSGVPGLISFVLGFAKDLQIERSTDVDGRHAVHYCFFDGSPGIGLSPEDDALKVLLDGGVSCQLTDRFNQDALAFCLTRHEGIDVGILTLLAADCDVHYQDQEGMYLIHHLAHDIWSPPIAKIIMYLRERGAPIKVVDQQGMSFIHHAAKAGNVTEELLSFLEEEVQLDLDLRDHLGYSALTYAIEMAERMEGKTMLWRYDRWQESVDAFRQYEKNRKVQPLRLQKMIQKTIERGELCMSNLRLFRLGNVKSAIRKSGFQRGCSAAALFCSEHSVGMVCSMILYVACVWGFVFYS